MDGGLAQGSSTLSSTIGDEVRLHPKLHEIDYVNETFVVSRLNLLQRHSDEPIKSDEAKLSARGVHHRSKERHTRDFASANAIITNAQQREKKERNAKISAQLVPPLFQRALAYERMNQLENAIADYKMILSAGKNASAYFNRAGIHFSMGNHAKALDDLNAAIKLDPLNGAYRNNKALVLRSQGLYFEAINETMVNRAIITLPEFVKSQVAQGGEILINSTQLGKIKPPIDPIAQILSRPREERTPKNIQCVVDFLSRLKFFAPFAKDHKLMQTIALKVELNRYHRDEFIFEEGMKGEHFYMVLDGEVSIVKCKKNTDGFVTNTTVLVKLFRGQTFGETALESVGGFRSAGALATSVTDAALLSMHVDDYRSVVLGYKLVLRGEVRLMLESCPAFRELSPQALDTLAESAILRSFNTGIEIIKAEDPSRTLYIVKMGIVRLTKQISKPSVAGVKLDVAAGQPYKQSPGLWVLEKAFKEPTEGEMAALQADGKELQGPGRRGLSIQAKVLKEMGMSAVAPPDPADELKNKGKAIEVTVGVVASGQLFGELAVLVPGQPSPISAYSVTPVELYCFTGESILAAGAKFSQVCIGALHDGISLHNPPAEKLAFYYRDKYAAETLRQGTLKEMKFDFPRPKPK